MIPVGDPGDDQAFKVGEDPFERFALERWLGRQRGDQVARLGAREDRVAARVAKIGLDPVADLREGGRPGLGGVHWAVGAAGTISAIWSI
jgi:hypothetical protein